MWIYIILMFICLISGILFDLNRRKKVKNIFCLLMFILLTIISGFRSINVGIDTYQFCYNYEIIAKLENYASALSATRYEKGFVTLCYFLSRISEDYQFLLIVTSVIIFASVVYFIKNNSKNIPLSFYLFITLNFFGMYMNVMRQAIAISIILIAYEFFLKKKKNIRFLICVILATFFHRSALIALIIPIIIKIKFRPRWIIFSFIFGTVFFLAGPKIISFIANMIGYGGYITKLDYFSSNYFGALLLFVVNLFLFIFCYFKRKNFNEYEMNLLKISFVALIISLCTIKISIIGRISEYFNIFNVILISNAITYVKKSKDRIYIKILLIVLLFLYWMTIAIYRPEWHGVVPYEFDSEVIK